MMPNKLKSNWNSITLLVILSSLIILSMSMPVFSLQDDPLTRTTYHRQDTTYTLSIIEPNMTSCILSSIKYSDGSQIIYNLALSSNGNLYYTIISAGNYSQTGTVCHLLSCSGSAGNSTGTKCLQVTPNGDEFDMPQAILSGIIFIILFLFLGFSIFGLMRAIKGEWQIFYACVTYVLLFCIFFVLWLFCNNYLYNTPIFASIFWIIWIILGGFFVPYLVLVSGYILKKEAEQLMADDYVKQGYSREDALEMAKRRKR